MSEVGREGEFQNCEPMSDVEKRFDVARHDLQILVSSASLQEFNSSIVGKLQLCELFVFE